MTFEKKVQKVQSHRQTNINQQEDNVKLKFVKLVVGEKNGLPIIG